jgi:hypothetical protein
MEEKPETEKQNKPELTISQDGHKLYAVMGYTDEKKFRKVAIERIPRQFLKMSDEDQKWFLNSQGVAKKLLKKLGLLDDRRKRSP